MIERRKYLLCPQCGSRRLMVTGPDGKDLYVYALVDHTFVMAKTGEPLPPDIDTTHLRCADCSWKGRAHKLVRYFSD